MPVAKLHLQYPLAGRYVSSAFAAPARLTIPGAELKLDRLGSLQGR